MGSYKVHIYSWSVPYHNHWSAQPQFGEVESCSSPDTLLNTVWEYPYRVVDMFELWVSESLGPLVGRWPYRPLCRLLGLREPRCKWLLRNVISHPLCLKTVIPVWYRWIILLLFQTICLLWPKCPRCCPQMNYFSPSDVCGQQSLDLRSWPSCVVPFVYGEVVLSPQCTNLCSPCCIEQHNIHNSVHAWVFCP